MSEPPDWATAIPNLASIHTMPTLPGEAGALGLTQDQITTFVKNLIEGLIREVVIDVVGVLLPGPAGEQLANWASDIFDKFGTIFDAFDGIDLSNPGSILTAILAFAGNLGDVILGLFGIDASGDPDPLALLSKLGTNLMSFLGGLDFDQDTADFDPIGQAKQFLQSILTPAGGLSSWTPIPSHLFGNLIPGAASANMLPDGSFDDPSVVDGLGFWSWNADGRTAAGCVQTTGNGSLLQLIGVPVATKPGAQVNFEVWSKWLSVTASAGNAIALCANAYDASDTIISDPTNRVVKAVTVPGSASSSYSGNVSGWVKLSGSYQAPAGTAYVRMCLEVASVVTAGTVRFDDGVQQLQNGFLDASILNNIENIPQLLGTSVGGWFGITDMIATLQNYTDGLGSALTQGGGLSGVDLPTLFGLQQVQTNNSITAAFQAALHTLILGNRTNKSAGFGANPTSLASLTADAYSNNGTLTTTSVTAGNCVGHRFTVPEFATYGFLEFQVYGTSLTNIFANIYKIDPVTNAKTALFNSSNIAGLIGTTNSHVRALLPGMPQVQASDELLFEIVNNGTNAMTCVYSPTAIPNNTNEVIQNTGWTRTVAAGGASPTSLTAGQGSYSGNVPYAVIGIADVPANYQPPLSTPYPSSGHHTWTPPSWQANGDIVDLVGCGAGGGGGGSVNFVPGQGGRAGSWNGVKLIVGTTIKLGSTVDVYTGVEGVGGNSLAQNGTGGEATVFTYTDPSNVTHTLTCTGGAGGNAGGNSGPGLSPGQYTFDLIPYFGGAAVAANAAGNAPGGGGGGAVPYFGGANGADGGGWVRAAQP